MVKFYSHSKLSTFEQCPQRYKFRYIDKIKPLIEKTIEAHLGTAVHNTLEWIYNSVKENSEKIPVLDEVIQKYIDEWQREFSEEILVVKKHLTAKDYFNKGIEFLANYYQNHYPFKDGTIECEKKVFVQLDENTKLQGFIDRLVHNIENGEYEVHDYKTANTLPSQEKMDQDRQLALYSIAIKELYGHDKEVTLVWHYLAHNQKIVSKRTNKQLEELKEETKKLIEEIESTTEFYTKPSVLCEWCEFKDICPAFNPNVKDNSKISPSKEQEKTEQSSINDFPTLKRYLRDEPQKNPADEENKELGVY